MRRLVDGAHAVVFRAPLGVEIERVDDSRALPLPDDARAEVIRLAHGEDDATPPGAVYQRLHRMGMADSGLPAVDARVMERLAQLGAPYAWQLDGRARTRALVEVLRRANSQRKVTFQEYGQTTCLPETGVARCLELEARVGPRRRVLLVGDDDMLSVVLARMGYDVTLLEIDPDLVAFLQRVAQSEGVHITALCQDVRDPLPDHVVGAFDAVMTDPMTFEPCLVSFLSRAASALRPGGIVLCALHPAGADMFAGVLRRLPFRVVDLRRAFSSYHDEGFQESWYHSDLVVLARTRARAPFAASERIPYAEIIQGAHGSRWHGWRWMMGNPFHKPTVAQVQAVLARIPGVIGLRQLDLHVEEDERRAHLFVAMEDGAHVAVSMDKRRGHLVAAFYPFHATRDVVVRQLFLDGLALAADGSFRAEITPITVDR